MKRDNPPSRKKKLNKELIEKNNTLALRYLDLNEARNFNRLFLKFLATFLLNQSLFRHVASPLITRGSDLLMPFLINTTRNHLTYGHEQELSAHQLTNDANEHLLEILVKSSIGLFFFSLSVANSSLLESVIPFFSSTSLDLSAIQDQNKKIQIYNENIAALDHNLGDKTVVHSGTFLGFCNIAILLFFFLLDEGQKKTELYITFIFTLIGIAQFCMMVNRQYFHAPVSNKILFNQKIDLLSQLIPVEFEHSMYVTTPKKNSSITLSLLNPKKSPISIANLRKIITNILLNHGIGVINSKKNLIKLNAFFEINDKDISLIRNNILKAVADSKFRVQMQHLTKKLEKIFHTSFLPYFELDHTQKLKCEMNISLLSHFNSSEFSDWMKKLFPDCVCSLNEEDNILHISNIHTYKKKLLKKLEEVNKDIKADARTPHFVTAYPAGSSSSKKRTSATHASRNKTPLSSASLFQSVTPKKEIQPGRIIWNSATYDPNQSQKRLHPIEGGNYAPYTNFTHFTLKKSDFSTDPTAYKAFKKQDQKAVIGRENQNLKFTYLLMRDHQGIPFIATAKIRKRGIHGNQEVFYSSETNQGKRLFTSRLFVTNVHKKEDRLRKKGFGK